MLRYALQTLRSRKGGFVGAFVALLCAAALVTACGVILETGLRGTIKPERYAATPVVVGGDQDVHKVTVKEKKGKKKVKKKAKPLAERVWVAEDLVGRVARVPGVKAAIGELTFPANAVTSDGRILKGTDGKASYGHAWESAALTPFALAEGRAPQGAGEVVLDRELARRAGVRVGDRLSVQATDAPAGYTVVGVAAPSGGDLKQQSSLFFSTAEARRLAGRPGQVAAIGVLTRDGADTGAVVKDVEAALADTTAKVHSGDDRGPAEFWDASKARTKLVSMGGAIGGTSLLVAILVVVGTFALLIQQRYRELALLRAIAATPRQVRQLLGREALIVGLVAGALGSVAGLPLAYWLREKFVEFGTIPDSLQLALSPFPMFAAVAAALFGAWASARLSARRASRIRPAEALSEAAMETRITTPGKLVAGLAVLAAGIVLLVVLSALKTEPASTPVTFLTVVVLAVAVSVLGPVLARGAVALLSVPLRLSYVGGYLAAANARANAKRLAAVVTPLTLLIGMACTVIFTQTTVDNAARTQAEAGNRADWVLASSGPGVPGAAARAVRDVPGVTAATEVVRTTVRVGLDKYPAQGVTPAGLTRTWDPGVSAGSLDGFDDRSVAVSEIAADNLGLKPGSTLKVTLGDGTPERLNVVAVYERGLGFGDLTMSHTLVSRHVDNPLGSAVLVKTDGPAAGTDGRQALSAAVKGFPGVKVLDRGEADNLQGDAQQANAEVKYVAMGLIIAFTAIAAVNTLAVSTADRAREFALLRLVGTTRRQVRLMLRLESLTVVVISTVLGTAVALATLTAFSVGMTGAAAPSLEPVTYLLIVALAGLLALGATLIPGRVALGGRPADAIGMKQ
ncbi:ABC transporter permease [Streptomyces blastmyceticus]|uniref:FtsX-like permease family protein n=1 Tax=Streptomyces blastmyceticus TaxID=68180 RepID=A0ABP3GBU6_9ACTN